MTDMILNGTVLQMRVMIQITMGHTKNVTARQDSRQIMLSLTLGKKKTYIQTKNARWVHMHTTSKRIELESLGC